MRNGHISFQSRPTSRGRDSSVHLTYYFSLYKQGGIPRVADFVHGSDGLGNIHLSPPNAEKIEKNAAEFLVDMVSEHPGEISILALGPLTNLALVSLLIYFSVILILSKSSRI